MTSPLRLTAGLLAVVALGGVLAVTPGCQTLRNLVSTPPGCIEFAQKQVPQYLKEGWMIADVGPAGEAADYIIFMRSVSAAEGDGAHLEVETWISRIDGSGPDDATLESNGFQRDSTCTWDGDPLPAQFGPGGTYWRRTGQQELPAGGKS